MVGYLATSPRKLALIATSTGEIERDLYPLARRAATIWSLAASSSCALIGLGCFWLERSLRELEQRLRRAEGHPAALPMLLLPRLECLTALAPAIEGDAESTLAASCWRHCSSLRVLDQGFENLRPLRLPAYMAPSLNGSALRAPPRTLTAPACRAHARRAPDLKYPALGGTARRAPQHWAWGPRTHCPRTWAHRTYAARTYAPPTWGPTPLGCSARGAPARCAH